MSKLCPLFSGSSGNSFYVESGKDAILIDIGRSAKQVENAIKINNLNIEKLKAIFITHEHIDHVRGLRVFATKYNLPVFASQGTIEALKNKGYFNDKFEYSILPDCGIHIGNLKIDSFRTSHDCIESLGFIIKTKDETSVAIASDLGFISTDIRDNLKQNDVVVIESNHEVSMLKMGPYPYELKKRILSPIGHLSNDDCSKELPSLVNSGVKHILLTHLSEDNNTESLAYQSAINALNTNGLKEQVDFTLNICPKINENKIKVFF